MGGTGDIARRTAQMPLQWGEDVVEWCDSHRGGVMTGCAGIHRRGRRGNGFARVEAAAVGFVVVVGVALMLAVSPSGRRAAMVNRDLANLRQIGAWTFAYGNDNEDLYPTLSSAPNSQWPKLHPTGQPLADAAKHAIDIIRRRTGREDFPLPTSWIPHVSYSQLVLVDYLDRALPDSSFVSSGDVHRMHWLDDPVNMHDQGFWQPFQNPQGGSGPVPPEDKRWPYSSSYQSAPALFDPGQSEWGTGLPVITQGTTHHGYSVPGGVVLGGQNLSRIAFPAQKVLVYGYGSWYTSRRPQYYAVESSAASTLMSDGGAAMRSTRSANPGWHPLRPASAISTLFNYAPDTWEPPTTNGSFGETVTGYYRWTRGGIKGRDFDGPEIDTGQR